jgi:broad specificity phosphatase PhoE
MHGAIRRTSTLGVWLAAGVLGAAVACRPAMAAAEPFPIERLDEGGYVVMLRHATAPGIGDPENFRLGDCATQRNLSEEGRAQARRLSERLRAGIASATVYSSQWCRCLETAELLDLGPVEELPALNSFFGRPEDRATNLDALRRFLANLAEDGPPVILVTHQVTISAITGRSAASGEAMVLEVDGTGRSPVVGTIEPQ